MKILKQGLCQNKIAGGHFLNEEKNFNLKRKSSILT